jgi:hypothetical protein
VGSRRLDDEDSRTGYRLPLKSQNMSLDRFSMSSAAAYESGISEYRATCLRMWGVRNFGAGRSLDKYIPDLCITQTRPSSLLSISRLPS